MSATYERTLSRGLNRASVALVVAVVAAAYVAFIGVRLIVFDGDPTGFVEGYDGRAYYRIALDPLTHQVTAEGITFTRPAYWQTRIGYPAMAWLFSAGGRAPLVPAAMVLVNLLAVLALALLAARLARGLGRSPWWGAVPAAWAGYAVGVGQDLTEPLAGALLLAALSAIRAGRHVPATLALTAAALTRETTLVVAAAVLLASLVSLPRRALPWWLGAVPLAVYAGWRTWVHARWSDLVPDPPSDNPLAPPLRAIGHYLGHALTHLGAEWPNLVLLVPTLAALCLTAYALRRGRGPLHERLALAGFLALLLCLPVWDRGQAYLRWGCEPMLLGWLLLVGTRSRALPALAVLTGLIWVVTATQSVGYPRMDGLWSGWWTWS